MNITGVLIISVFFGLAICIAYKAEYHFQYLKMIYPEKYGRFNSIIDAMNKFKFINPLILLPLFTMRDNKLEMTNKSVNILASKIKRVIFVFYILLILGITIIIFSFPI